MRLVPIIATAFIAGASFAAVPASAADSGTMLPNASKTPTDLPDAGQAKVDTATFIKTVASANAFEIESSKLAEKKGVASDVGDFAALMIKDHTKAGQDFAMALDKVQTTTASVKPSSDSPLLPPDEARLGTLAKADGAVFQTQYIAMQAEAHRQAVALFSAYAASGDDPALREFAKTTLPVLKMHEMHVKDLQAVHKG